ncbi:MAG: hypothetical protein QMD14_00770 [Candidatus Aenigmarchaeota archaeon]|nr:hypothetical protein [Candidatus Aenigmarchaeota archaeon]
MRYVPTGRTLTNPLLAERLLYILEPFLDDIYFPSKSKQYKKMLEDIRGKIDAYTKGPLEIYRIYHEKLLPRIASWKNNFLIFTTGVSVDQASSQIVCIDPFGDRFKLSDLILNIFHELYDEWLGRGNEFPLNKFIFTSVAPVVWPYKIVKVDGKFQMEHREKKSTEETNELMIEKGKRTFGDIVRTLESDFRLGNYKFSEAMFNSRSAKILYPDKEENLLEAYTTFNRYIMANAFATVMRKAGLKKHKGLLGTLHLYAKRTGYAYPIMELAARIAEVELNDFGKSMRNTLMSKEGECDKSAINILKGGINTLAMELYETR